MNKKGIFPVVIGAIIMLIFVVLVVGILFWKQAEKNDTKEIVVDYIGWCNGNPNQRPLNYCQERVINECEREVKLANEIYGDKLKCSKNPCRLLYFDHTDDPICPDPSDTHNYQGGCSKFDTKCWIEK